MSGLTTSPSAQATTPAEHRYGPEDAHMLDLYLPQGASDAPLPLLILAHGGLWQSGDKSALAGLCANIVSQSKGNIACASISYRLSQDLGGTCEGTGQATYHDQLGDLVLAYQWLQQRAEPFGIDPQRLFIGGHSAGGHLAQTLNLRWEQFANTCKTATCMTPPGFIGLEGIYDISAWDRYDRSFWDGRFECATRKAFGAPGPDPTACTENPGQNRCWDMGSPTWLADNAKQLGVKPLADMLLVHSSGDNWVDIAETRNLYEKAKQAWPGLDIVVETDGRCAKGQHNDMLEETSLAECIIDFMSTRSKP